MKTVVALDPGGTTGVAIRTPGAEQQQQFQVSTNTPGGLFEIWDILRFTRPDVLVVERFQFRYGGGRSRVDLTPVEVIGVAKLYYFETNRSGHEVVLYEQTPSQAKKFITDEKIRKLGLWLPGQPHAMDATRHLLYHLIVTRREKRWLELLRKKD